MEGKQFIERHSDMSYELKQKLRGTGKADRLDQIREPTDLSEIHYVRQKGRNGVEDAVNYT